VGVQGSPSVRLLGSMWGGMTKGGDQNNAKGPKGQSAKRGFITRDCLRMLPAFALANCGFSCSTNTSSWAPHLRLTWRAFGVLAGPVVFLFFYVWPASSDLRLCARLSCLRPPSKKKFFFLVWEKRSFAFSSSFSFSSFPFCLLGVVFFCLRVPPTWGVACCRQPRP